MADVAFLAKLPKSMLSRLWDEEDWLDRSSRDRLSVLPVISRSSSFSQTRHCGC